MKNKSYIYLITNLINNHKYIGQTINLKQRWKQHCNKAHNSMTIDKAINKYGKENFSLSVLEICNIDDANEREIYWIAKYNTFYNTEDYNCHIGGQMQYGENNPMYNKKGEDCPTSKVTYEIGLTIYNDMKSNNKQTIYDLSKRYNLSTPIISEICKGIHWSTLGLKDLIKDTYKTKNKLKLTNEQYLNIYQLYEGGHYTLQQLADLYGISIAIISKVCRGKHSSTKDKENLLQDKRTSSKLTLTSIESILDYYKTIKYIPNIKRKEIYQKIKDLYPYISIKTIQRICYKYDKEDEV